MAKELNKKQKRFADEYLVDMNQTRAYIAAGYSENGAAQSASALLRNPNVAAYIEKKSEKRAEKLELSAESVLKGIKEVTEICQRPGALFDPKAALKGYELMGKHLKLFTDKAEVSGPNGGPIVTSLEVKFCD